MTVITKDDAVRAGHTLWQTAGGYAAASTIVSDYARGDSHDAKLALVLAGSAVGAAVLSLMKSRGVRIAASVNRYLKWTRSPVHIDPAVLDAAVQRALADAKAGDSAKHVAADVVETVAPAVRLTDPYLAAPTP